MRVSFKDRLSSGLIILSLSILVLISIVLIDLLNGLQISIRHLNSNLGYSWSELISIKLKNDAMFDSQKVRDFFGELGNMHATVAFSEENDFQHLFFFSGGELPVSTVNSETVSIENMKAKNYGCGYFGDYFTKDIVETDEGLFLDFDGERLYVCGIVSKRKMETDDSYYVYYGTLSERMKDRLTQDVLLLLKHKMGITILVGSNEQSIQADVENIIERAKMLGFSATTGESRNNQEGELGKSVIDVVKMLLFFVAGLFGLGNLYYSLSLWMGKRKREIAVLYACGAGKGFIVKHLLIQLVPSLLFAMVLTLLGVLLLGSLTSIMLTYMMLIWLGAITISWCMSFLLIIVSFMQISKSGFLDYFASER